MNRIVAGGLLTALIALTAPTAQAQATFDRAVRPSPGPTPAVKAPAVAKRTLSNGLEIWTVTQRELPSVSALLVIRAGSALDGAKGGLSSMTAGLLDEGTSRRSSLEFARAVDMLGAGLGAFSDDERTTVSLTTLKKTADSAFALMGELLTDPAFPAEEIERDRKARLQSLRQQKDQPTVIASQTFARKVYGDAHPYGRPGVGTPGTVGALTRDDVTGFYSRFYRPNNAVLVLVGDLTAEEGMRYAERAFGRWQRAALPAEATARPPRPAAKPVAVYLVDKPEAAQSEIRIGHPGAPRSTDPDYYALQVLNVILGGQFSSRINLNLREAKGYTYGARSGWSFNRGDGPFVASAGVFTAKTDSSVIEFLKELNDIRSGRPPTAEEVEFAKGVLIRGYPRRIETNGGVAAQLGDLAFFGLPESELGTYLTRIEAVRPADVTRVAQRYLQPDQFTVVVVGDLAKIRSGIEALKLGPVSVLDAEGNAVP